MSEDPHPDDQYIAQVVAAYAAAEQYLLTHAAGILRRLTPTFEGPFLALSRLRTLVRGTVEKLAPLDEVARAGIMQAAQDGATTALAPTGGGAGQKPPDPPRGALTPTGPEPFNLSMPHGERAAQAIADDVVSSLEDVRRRITRLPDDVYKLISPQAAMGQVLDNGVAPEQAQAVAWRAFTERGITGFVDKSGRNWSLSAYVEMSVRTAAARAFNDSHMQTMRALGLKYFTVPVHGAACPLCWPWQGAVLVETPIPHPDIPVDATIAQAVAAGLMHPNCRHTLIAVYPGITVLPERTPWTDVQQAEYDASQKQRQIEREIRRGKQQERDALTPEARKKASIEIRKAQARMRELTAATGRARDSRREQLNLRQDRSRTAPPTSKARREVPAGSSSTDPRIRETRLTLGVDRRGRVDVPDGLHLEEHEVGTAHRLAAVGINVHWNELVQGDHVKNIDVTIDGKPWEFKSPQGASKNTIAHQWSRAKAQGAQRLVIDMSRTSLSDQVALNELRRRLAGDDQIRTVLHIAHDGTVTRLTRT